MAVKAINYLISPLPSVDYTAGFPSIVPAKPVNYLQTPLVKFDIDDVITIIVNPLTVKPVHPLPAGGSGTGTGQSSYVF